MAQSCVSPEPGRRPELCCSSPVCSTDPPAARSAPRPGESWVCCPDPPTAPPPACTPYQLQNIEIKATVLQKQSQKQGCRGFLTIFESFLHGHFVRQLLRAEKQGFLQRSSGCHEVAQRKLNLLMRLFQLNETNKTMETFPITEIIKKGNDEEKTIIHIIIVYPCTL